MHVKKTYKLVLYENFAQMIFKKTLQHFMMCENLKDRKIICNSAILLVYHTKEAMLFEIWK